MIFRNYVPRYQGMQIFVLVYGFTIEYIFIYMSGYMLAIYFSYKSSVTEANIKIASGVVRTMIEGKGF